MISFRHVDIGFSSTLFSIPVLDLVPGNLFAVIGQNGIGKSTFFKTILGEVTQLSGEVLLNGESIITMESAELAKKIAYVHSTFNGVEHMCVYDYLCLARFPYRSWLGRISETDEQIIKQVSLAMNVVDLWDRDTTALSDGQRMLCAIARALIQDTPIILMDEPLAFLDLGNKINLLNTISHQCEQHQKLIIYSTHDLELMKNKSQRYLIINPTTKQMVEESVFSSETLSIAFPDIQHYKGYL